MKCTVLETLAKSNLHSIWLIANLLTDDAFQISRP